MSYRIIEKEYCFQRGTHPATDYRSGLHNSYGSAEKSSPITLIPSQREDIHRSKSFDPLHGKETGTRIKGMSALTVETTSVENLSVTHHPNGYGGNFHQHDNYSEASQNGKYLQFPYSKNEIGDTVKSYPLDIIPSTTNKQTFISVASSVNNSNIAFMRNCERWMEKVKTPWSHVTPSFLPLRKEVQKYENLLEEGNDLRTRVEHEVPIESAEEWPRHLHQEIRNLLTYCEGGKEHSLSLLDVTSLENNFCTLLNRVEDIAIAMATICSNVSPQRTATAATMTSALNSIDRLGDTWRWIAKIKDCIVQHLRNASFYHQFYFKLMEYNKYLEPDITYYVQKLQYEKDLTQNDVICLAANIKECGDNFAAWQNRVRILKEESTDVTPIYLRRKPLTTDIDTVSMTPFSSVQGSFVENEKLILTDNRDSFCWNVRTSSGIEMSVPSVIILIPQHDSKAVDDANSLEMRLNTLWQISLLLIGEDLLRHLHLVLERYGKRKSPTESHLSDHDKRLLRSIVGLCKSLFDPLFNNNHNYEKLIPSIRRIQEDLNGNIAGPIPNECSPALSSVEQLLLQYQNLMQLGHEGGIEPIETNRHREMHELSSKSYNVNQKFVSSAYFTKFRPFITAPNVSGREESKDDLFYICESGKSSRENSKGNNQSQNYALMDEENMDLQDLVTPLQSSSHEHADVHISTKEEKATTTEIVQTHMEEDRKFTISSVYDPRVRKQISIEDALNAGILNPAKGEYCNPDLGEAMPIPLAMEKGFIVVEYTKIKRGEEKKKSFGLITLETHKDHQPYVIKSAFDTSNQENVSLMEAQERGIIREDCGIFRNLETGNDAWIRDAIDAGYVHVEYDSSASRKTGEEISKTYAVYGVVDQKRKEIVDYDAAIRLGLLDTQTGAYINNVTNNCIFVGEAIVKGFIKATTIADPSKLDINPDNRVVVRNIRNLRNKVKALAAFSTTK